MTKKFNVYRELIKGNDAGKMFYQIMPKYISNDYAIMLTMGGEMY